MPTTKAYAALAAQSPLSPLAISRRELGPADVQIEVLFCGVCHSDLHQARNEWHNTVYPCVPGHEIVGRVSAAGSNTKFRPGDLVAVGCLVDSCRVCVNCRDHLEPLCSAGATATYNGKDHKSGGVTFGGYSERIVVDEHFVFRLPAGLDPASAAPLLCAGITTYSPLRHWNVGPGQTIGVVGLGGLGHMGVKLAAAMGAKVVLFTTSPGKAADAKRLGAADIVLSTDPAAMKARHDSLDFILNTVSAKHDLHAYLPLLKRDCTMVLLGARPEPLSLFPFGLIFGRRRLSGSFIGGVKETQEMLDFCAQHRLACDVEIINIQQIDEAYERLLKNDVKYRFVIDMKSLAGAKFPRD